MNIGRLLNDTAAAHPDRLATQQGERKQDYRQFNARVNRLAHALTRLGATPGKNVAILMTNVPEMLEAMFAIFKIGCGAVPINFRLHPLEIAYIITHSQSPVLITEESFQSPLKEVREDLAGLRYTISTGHGTEGVFSYESIVAAESDSYREVDVDPDHVAWLFYTSGTTGQPKGAMLTHRNLLGMTERFHQDILRDPGDDEVVLHAAPLSHGSGLYALPNVENAATHLFLETSSFNAEKVLRLFAEERVTNLFAAPAMM